MAEIRRALLKENGTKKYSLDLSWHGADPL
jgi:hypothetical protein